MGTTFANLQVRIEDREKLIEKLKIFGSANYSARFYVGTFKKGWISILGDDYEWESIAEDAALLSKELECAVISIGYFDDDVLEIALHRKGQEVTRHIAGDGLGAYEIESQMMDIDLFLDELDGTVNRAKLEEAFQDADIEITVHTLEEILQLPLWIKFEWIETEGAEVQAQFEYVAV